jgi:hypothetical protein
MQAAARSRNKPHEARAERPSPSAAERRLMRSGGREVPEQGPLRRPTMAFSDLLAIVRLDGSSPFPQVVVRHFTGGAHCCTP